MEHIVSHAFTSPIEEILKVYVVMKLLVRRCCDMSLCQLLCPELGVVLCLLLWPKRGND